MKISDTLLKASVFALAAGMIFGATGCAKKASGLSFDSLEQIFTKHKAEPLPSGESFDKYLGSYVEPADLNRGFAYYKITKGDESREKFTGAISAAGQQDLVNVELRSFGSENEAEDYIRNNYINVTAENSKSIDPDAYAAPSQERTVVKDGIRYYVFKLSANSGGCAYQIKDKVMVINYILEEKESDLIDDVCNTFSLTSPLNYDFSKKD